MIITSDINLKKQQKKKSLTNIFSFIANILLMTFLFLNLSTNFANAEDLNKNKINNIKKQQRNKFKKANKEIVVIAKFYAKKGKENDLLYALHSLIEKTLQEKGCIRYELNQKIDDPRVITFVEKWAGMDVFEKHNNMEYITNYFKKVAPKLIESKEITLYKEILP